MLEYLKNIFKRKQYLTEKQKQAFKKDSKKEVAKKLDKMKEENDRLDDEIKQIQLDIFLLENDINLN
ncbi:hypothetical protein [uncultured Tenacibaculum sp.]|uniref:hypothetical protein n=1 Tax=uncultured Tenacibaculum sp. TaxID=174713 RepID=UPI0026232126|nr:hypothetical protein [uncultured Tenacibaculum sp.]